MKLQSFLILCYVTWNLSSSTAFFINLRRRSTGSSSSNRFRESLILAASLQFCMHMKRKSNQTHQISQKTKKRAGLTSNLTATANCCFNRAYVWLLERKEELGQLDGGEVLLSFPESVLEQQEIVIPSGLSKSLRHWVVRGFPEFRLKEAAVEGIVFNFSHKDCIFKFGSELKLIFMRSELQIDRERRRTVECDSDDALMQSHIP